MTFLIIINAFILLLIALLHIYWVLGGTRFFKDALPTRVNGKFIFYPKPLITFIVAIGLFLFALVTIGNLGIFDNFVRRTIILYGTNGVGAIFLLRAIGDFHYIGFSKKVKETQFAKKDTKIYTPLSLIIAITSFTISIFS